MTFADLVTFWDANRHLLAQRTYEHLELMCIAVAAAGVCGLPAGIVAARVRWLATPFLTLANLVQTIPSVALLGFLLPLFGIGRNTAAVALFLYALLPIVRNTIAGLRGVDPAVVDAARGMGMSERQILWGVELPLARPIIFAGIRTAAVINVGVTTLSALIGAGGLGTFIFRGLATNHTAVILLGAIPAALLALMADGLLATVERALRQPGRAGRVLLALAGLGVAATVGWRVAAAPDRAAALRFGFTSEFMERPDGYAAWRARYGLPALVSRELDPGLLYDALRSGAVDVACGFSTDGRIAAFGLRPLRDDRQFFPAYEAAVLARRSTLARLPALGPVLARLRGALDETRMRQLNLRVDRDKLSPAAAATEFLTEWTAAAGLSWQPARARAKAEASGPVDLVVGTKNFSEQYILGQILQQLINGATDLRAGLKPGLGGTAICFQALQRGDIDLYPEYSGTVLAAILRPPADQLESLARDPVAAESYLRAELARRLDLAWLAPFGFSNTYALLVRGTDERLADITTISELRDLAAR